MIDRQYSSYCFLASELSIEKKIKYSRHAAYSQSMGDMFQPHLRYTLTFCQTFTSRSRYCITTLFHSSVHFFPVLVKGLRKIAEICKFDIPNTHINDPSWLSSGTSIISDGDKLVYRRFFKGISLI
jgi:hypothetical protein